MFLSAMRRKQANPQANIWVARGVPVCVLGILGYCTWVITKSLCVDYLLQSPSISFTTPQTGPAAAILVIYYILLCIMLVCYARLLYVVTRNPGIVPRPPRSLSEKKHSSRSRRTRRKSRDHHDPEKSTKIETESSSERHTAEAVTRTCAVEADLQVENFWKRDVFVCAYDGWPAFCSTCRNWKPDRARHCKELDRCVLKMDHFCPWVGGVVGENSFKFFIQFTFWAAMFCTHVLTSVAYYLAQRRRTEGVVNANWPVILGLCGFFLLFGGGMCTSSLHFAVINSTTIENLVRKRKVWYLAVHVPDHALSQIEERGRSNLRFITHPCSDQAEALKQRGTDLPDEVLNEVVPSSDAAPRTFAILETAPGANPFDLGWNRNFQDVMGQNLFEWLFPIRPSPCIKHDSAESFYAMGEVVEHLKQEARITAKNPDLRKRSKHGRRRRKSRPQRDNHAQDGAHAQPESRAQNENDENDST